MEITMNNEEIKLAIMEHQKEIKKCLEECSCSFELNPGVVYHRKCIDDLREECTHLNNNHELQIVEYRCAYCGKILK